jgi:ankyrin repeat protein
MMLNKMNNSSAGETLIFEAIKAKDLQRMEEVVNTDNVINQLCERNDLNEYKFSTPLLYSIQEGWHQGISFLIDCGANVQLCLGWEPTPLGLAVEQGDLESTRLLLRAGANPNKGGIDIFPLHDAVSLNRFDIMELLIQAGIQINSRNHSGFTPLMIAAQNGDLSCVGILVKAFACIDFIDYEHNETAIEIARKHGHEEIVNYLLSTSN